VTWRNASALERNDDALSLVSREHQWVDRVIGGFGFSVGSKEILARLQFSRTRPVRFNEPSAGEPAVGISHELMRHASR
jgi:hypothetical protein